MANYFVTRDDDMETNVSSLVDRLTEARAGYLDDTHDALSHLTGIFPGDSNLFWLLTAGQPLNTWGAWAEINDSDSNSLGDLLATKPGRITIIQEEELSDVNTVYHLELAYGDSKTPVSSQRFAGSGKFQNPDNHARVFGRVIPAGEKVYYRMKSNTAVADTAKAHLRYHLYPF